MPKMRWPTRSISVCRTLSGAPLVEQAPGERLDQTVDALGGLQQNRPAVGAGLLLLETRHAAACRTDPGTEQSVVQCRLSRRGLRGGASGCQHCTCTTRGLLCLYRNRNTPRIFRASLSKDERKAAFQERAGRQLLVALHEATLGRPFEEIIADEYRNILPPAAQDMYLTICLLNRLEVGVRAGLISRVHDIPFHYFQAHFFQPLEHVVNTLYSRAIRDHVYVARHPSIAEMVFRQILKQPADRLEKYLRTIVHMNLDYSTDERAFRKMFRARILREMFPERSMVEHLFSVGRDLAGDDPFLLHQIALYEMHAPDGDLGKAGRLLSTASKLARRDLTLKHSQAELQLMLAEKARGDVEREERIRESARMARELRRARTDTDSAHAYHTLAKVALKKLEWRLTRGPENSSGLEANVVMAIREVEETLSEGLQQFPEEPYLLDAEAKLARLLKDAPRALSAMKSAFEADPRNGNIALRLARTMEEAGFGDEAREVLTTAIEARPTDIRLHYRLARLLMKRTPREEQLVLYHLQRSFVQGDKNYGAQLLYARELFLSGRNADAEEVFCSFKTRNIAFERRTLPRHVTEEVFKGRVQRVEATYCFVQRDEKGDRIFAHRRNIDHSVFRLLGTGSRVTFRLGFTFAGVVAVDLQIPGKVAI